MSRISVHILNGDGGITFCGRAGQDVITDGRPVCRGCLRVKEKTSWQDRFWSKVNKTDYCWVWTSAINTKGYGVFHINGKVKYAHRLSFVLFGRVIPDGLVLDHLCRRTECVNPDHLEAVSPAVNSQRGKCGKKQFCKHGHPFDASNSYIRKDNGARMCKACGRNRNRIAGRKKYGAIFIYVNCGSCGKRFCGKKSRRHDPKYCSKKCCARASMAAYKERQMVSRARDEQQYFQQSQRTSPA